MPEYVKHLVECKCILPQFKKMDDPPFHKFPVFSELEESTGAVIPSYTQCPHCAAVHRVKEVGVSTISNKEMMLSLPTADDIKPSLPEWLAALLDRHGCDIATWQEAKFIVENKMWGRPIILAKEHDGNTIIGKYVTILDENNHKVETFERLNDVVETVET